MEGVQYCNSCQRLFRGEVSFSDYTWWELEMRFTHHNDLEEFKSALDLPCALCWLAWAHQDLSLIFQRGKFRRIRGRLIDKKLFFWTLKGKRRIHSESLNFSPCDVPDTVPKGLSPNTGSWEALEFIRSKYRACCDNHTGCGVQSAQKRFYPSRVIDVGELNDASVHLCDTLDFDNRGPYFCLSHVWGDSTRLAIQRKADRLLLNKETLSILRSGLALSVLPQTFQDAVSVTRQLGVRFLWIDSLCIFQDNLEDWACEAARMKDVYSQAACTIAATAAKDSYGGLFFERQLTSRRPLRILITSDSDPATRDAKLATFPASGPYWCDYYDEWKTQVEEAPLNKRAWVSQERHLSPRTIHFGRTQIFWECHECLASEVSPLIAKSPFHPGALKQTLHEHTMEPKELSSSQSGCNEITPLLDDRLYYSWLAFRRFYSRCSMTREEDKLVALQGIAQQYALATGDQLVAGLWRSRLIQELTWHRENVDRPARSATIWRAPTWSWASCKDEIFESSNPPFWARLKSSSRIQCWSTVSDFDVSAKASGELEHARLYVQCRPMHVILEPDNENTYFGLSLKMGKLRLGTSPNYRNNIDVGIDDQKWEKTRHVHMFITRGLLPEKDATLVAEEDSTELVADGFLEGLLLEREQDSEDTFKRAGVWTTSRRKTINSILQEHEAGESKTIILI